MKEVSRSFMTGGATLRTWVSWFISRGAEYAAQTRAGYEANAWINRVADPSRMGAISKDHRHRGAKHVRA